MIAAPGTPKAQEMPSFSRTRTAASTARILAILQPSTGFVIVGLAEDASTPAIFQFFQNIFSFIENDGYALILLDFPFSSNSAGDISEKFFHCAFGEIGRE
ncbi:hypothetical protein [Mesorhizobium ciceri]|uniref:hypothetical protein n=1 Tax=Mesorhizobium ciceri TaxID=39645 RepID=UPI00375737CC